MIVWFILWSVFLVVMTVVIGHAIAEFNKSRKHKDTDFQVLNRRFR